MIILIEGMDNSGKTTLAAQLRDAFRIPIMTSARYQNKNPAEIDRWVNWMFATLNMGQEHPLLLDRFPLISEAIYGPIVHGGNILESHPKYEQLLLEFCQAQPSIIYCRPPATVLFNWGNRQQMPGVKENSNKLLDAYDNFMVDLDKQVFWYDYTRAASRLSAYNFTGKVVGRW